MTMLFLIIAELAFILWRLCLWAGGWQAKQSGEAGENRVSGILRRKGFQTFDDLLFELGDHTVQIDHLAVSKRGILVVESKNHHGRIIGNAYERHWTQQLRETEYSFYNPVWQNYGHKKAAGALLCVPDERMTSIVVFASDPELNLVDGGNKIVTASGLESLLAEHQDDVFTQSEVDRICRQIKALNKNSRKAMKKHICFVSEKQENKIA